MKWFLQHSCHYNWGDQTYDPNVRWHTFIKRHFKRNLASFTHAAAPDLIVSVAACFLDLVPKLLYKIKRWHASLLWMKNTSRNISQIMSHLGLKPLSGFPQHLGWNPKSLTLLLLYPLGFLCASHILAYLALGTLAAFQFPRKAKIAAASGTSYEVFLNLDAPRGSNISGFKLEAFP